MTKNSRKILVLGKRGGILRWYEAVTEACATQPGVEVRSFALNHNSAADRLANSLTRAFSRERAEQRRAQQLRQLLASWTPDLVWVVDLIKLSAPMQELLQELPAGTVRMRWVGDKFGEGLLEERPCIDHYCFTDTALMAEAREQGFESVSLLPLAWQPVMATMQRTGNDPRLLFVGAWSENRQKLLEEVSQPVRILGGRWQAMHSDVHDISPGNISLRRVAELYHQHSSVLNIINSDNVSVGLNMRAFDVTASGALLFNDNVADLMQCFTPGEELLVYESPQQLDELYQRARREPQWAEGIAERGRQRSLDEHSYFQRARQVLQALL